MKMRTYKDEYGQQIIKFYKSHRHTTPLSAFVMINDGVWEQMILGPHNHDLSIGNNFGVRFLYIAASTRTAKWKSKRITKNEHNHWLMVHAL